ncbi:hypothetical protein [Rhizosphaericola mali]|uniref:Uncharacterized protein n=1 Tax=Rhizosphaericola mali TaxID=2545455 RepID=A0A5P2G1W5_9BACT|nr:hypothetical protein [Rhizosphaericola mali]QES89445.1 hypothetical protein E0W69_012480 [Rhizosphaericola mali]
MNIKNTFSNYIISFVIITFWGTISACSKSSVNEQNTNAISDINAFDTTFTAVINLVGKSTTEVKSFLKDRAYITTTNGNIISFKNTYSAFNIPNALFQVDATINNNNQVNQISIAYLQSEYTTENVKYFFKSIDSSMRANSYTNQGLSLWQKVYNNKDSSVYKVETKYSDSTLNTITDSTTLQFETNYISTNSLTAQLRHTTPVQLALTITQ